MASTYVNNLRLEEIATGEQSGTWGATTNTNMELIGQAVAWGTRAIANASTDNITIADGAADADRCLGLKLTGGGQACTVTLLPNTSSKTWFMYNATSYTLTFTCGSGANVAILAGQTKVISSDGLGSGGVVYDLLTAVNLAGTTQTAAVTTQGTLTVGVDDTGYDVKLFGATSGAYMLWDESADDLKRVGAAGFTVAGDIDVDGTANLDIVDIDGAVDMASTLTVAGVLTGASLDISGDIDIDGTANLDIVDVDGAVNFAADVTYADGADIITSSAGTSNFRAGVNAGNSIESGGNYNVVVGDEAGTAITTGDRNTAVGYQALDATNTGGENVAIGWGAASTNTTGTGLVAIGDQALEANTTAINNTAVGKAALKVNTTGASNVAVGYNALDANTTASNNTAVGLDALSANTTGASNVAVGYQALDANTTADDNIALGVASLGANTTGHSNTSVGGYSLDANTTGVTNTAVGKYSLSSNTTASSNTAIGNDSLASSTTAAQNTAVGYQALVATTTGSYNVGVGYASLTTNTTGTQNAALGRNSLNSNTTGTQNTAVGNHALHNNTTSSNNTAVGYQSLYVSTTGTGNVAVGYQALDANTTADNNTAVGTTALGANTEGFSNTGLGKDAGSAITTGDNNTCLGYQAGISGSPGGAVTTGNNQLCLGDENVANAHVQVDWTVASDQRDKTDFTALDLGLDFVKALEPVTYKWDKRSKYAEDGDDLDTILRDGTHKEDWLDVGFKAQAVEALEQAAGYNISDKTNLTTSLTDDGKQYGLQYSKFVPILVKAIQEQQTLIEALTARITTLEG